MSELKKPLNRKDINISINSDSPKVEHYLSCEILI